MRFVVPGVDFKIGDEIEEPSQKRQQEERPLFENETDIKAKNSGFLVIFEGDFYSKQISFGSTVFIQKKHGTWGTWRETWGNDGKQSKNVKVIVSGVPFSVALQKAKTYINRFSDWRNKKK